MSTILNKEDEFSIPLCISDLLDICKNYSMLGWNIQSQIEQILELGVEQAIQHGVNPSSLPHIKSFLAAICSNPYFGDATSEACECIEMISSFQEKNPSIFKLKVN